MMMAHREGLFECRTGLAPDNVHMKIRNHFVGCAGSNGEN